MNAAKVSNTSDELYSVIVMFSHIQVRVLFPLLGKGIAYCNDTIVANHSIAYLVLTPDMRLL